MQTLNDDQDFEVIRRVWNRYGNRFLIALIVFLVVLLGTQYVQYHRDGKSTQASLAYDLLLNQVQEKDIDFKKLQSQAEKFISDYPGTSYASFAELFLVRAYAEQNELDKAIDLLSKSVERTNKGHLHAILAHRLSNLYVEKKDFDKAEKILKDLPSEYDFMKEYALAELNVRAEKWEEAFSHFEAAIKIKPENFPKDWIEMQMYDVTVK